MNRLQAAKPYPKYLQDPSAPHPDSTPVYKGSLGIYKDHIEKIDFQELIFAVVNWPNSELYGAFVCIICYIG